MRKRTIALMTAGCMILSVCGCGTNKDAGEQETSIIPIIIENDDMPGSDVVGVVDTDADGANGDDTGAVDTDTNGANGDDTGVVDTDTNGANDDDTGALDTDADKAGDTSLSFADFHYLTFWFASGAGAWATQLSIRSDGSFAGEYHDSDMGSFGAEYPYGTRYQCTFNGQFSQPVKVNDYTYSMQILSISYAKEPDTSEIKDGTLYHYTTPYGLDEAETILIYLPGAPLTELPEGYRSWVGYYYLENTTDTKLPYYGLYNEAEAEGFSSRPVADALKDSVSFIEEQAAAIEDAIEHDAALSQAELNVKSGELFELWDSMLNHIWDNLKWVNDADTMRALTDEQLIWIAEKEAAIDAAGTEFEGSSLLPLARNMKAAELTKARVYELLALLES